MTFVLKLAAFGLLDELPALFGVTIAEILLGPAAVYCFRKPSRALRRDWSAEALASAVAFAEAAAKLTEPPDDSEHVALTATEDIDSGEVILFAGTRHYQQFILCTGDKRCARALAASQDCQAVYDRLRGRVLCLEQLLLRFIDRSGFDWVCARVRPARKADTATKVAFSSGEENTAIEALRRYVRNLDQECSGLLGPDGLER